MNELLQALVDAATGLIQPDSYNPRDDNAERVNAVRDALSAYRTENPDAEIDLIALEREALALFDSRRTDAGGSAEAVAALGAVVDVVDAVDAEIKQSEANASALAALSDRVTSRAPREQAPAEPAAVPAADDDTPETPAEPAPEPVTTPAEPAAPVEPQATTPPAAPGGTEAPEGAPQAAAQEPVLTAAGRAPAVTTPRVPLGALPNDANRSGRKAYNNFTLTASADIPGVPMGTNLNGMTGLVEAVGGRLQALARAGVDTSAGIATLEREVDPAFLASKVDISDLVAHVCDERRLDGGSLVAAAGWCAPAEVQYDFCPTAQVYGLVDLPSITTRRGAIQWPVSPSFSSIYSQTGFYLSNADMQKGEVWDPGNPGTFRPNKPCYLITCPDNQRCDLDVIGLCLKSPILTERAYPELIEYFTAQALAAHAHKINAFILKSLEALTIQVTKPAGASPEWGPGATATALGVIELQVEYLRNHYRLGDNATMEMIAPMFLRGILRSDLAKRAGVDLLDVDNATLTRYLTNRGVNVQWVVDWQDAFAGPATPINPDPAAANPGTGLPTYAAAGFGGDTPPTAWPQNVKVMIYPAGTYFVARQDIITIEGLYDSALLQRNMHLALFTEEGIKVCSRGCYQGLTVTLPLCPDGMTGGPVANTEAWDCTAGAA